MRQLTASSHWRWAALSAGLLLTGVLAVGCGGGSDGGSGDFSQQFEKPAATPKPPPVEKINERDLSPREKRDRKRQAGG